MADTYAVVQKRGPLAVTRSGSGARGAEEAPLYSQVTPRAQRPQAPAEDVRGTLPGRGESGRPRERAGRAPACWTSAPRAGCRPPPEVLRATPGARGLGGDPRPGRAPGRLSRPLGRAPRACFSSPGGGLRPRLVPRSAGSRS